MSWSVVLLMIGILLLVVAQMVPSPQQGIAAVMAVVAVIAAGVTFVVRARHADE